MSPEEFQRYYPRLLRTGAAQRFVCCNLFVDRFGSLAACPTGEKLQQAQTYRGKNVQSVGSLLINNQAATQALRASVTEFCVPAGRHRPLDNVQILVGASVMGLALLFFVARLAG